MSRPRKGAALDAALAELRSVAAAPAAPESAAKLRAALSSPQSPVVARAAELVGRHLVPGLERDLAAAFRRHLDDAVKRDPSCLAKAALAEALDAVESLDPEPFLAGARHVQLEAAWGPPVDTAAGLRARSLAALARIGPDDALLRFAEGLADPIASVRQAAAQAVAWYGHRDGAALVLLKLRLGDEEAEVLAACLSSLLSVAPDAGLAVASDLLAGPERALRPLAALALGESRRPEAVAPLARLLEQAVTAADRRLPLTALATHRSEAARAVLLDVIRGAGLPAAQQAVAALGMQRFDPRVRGEVEEAAGPRLPALARDIAAAFPESDG